MKPGNVLYFNILYINIFSITSSKVTPLYLLASHVYSVRDNTNGILSLKNDILAILDSLGDADVQIIIISNLNARAGIERVL